MKPHFSILVTDIQTEPNSRGSQLSFIHDNSIRDVLGFDSFVIYEKPNLSFKRNDIF